MVNSQSPSAAIAATGLCKSYGKDIVLDGIDLLVPPGTIFSMLGPNGAGKTTAVRILTTLIKADSGSMWVAGHSVTEDPEAVRRTIGVTGQFSAVDRLLTGEENLVMMGNLNHLPRRDPERRAIELLDRFGLSDAARKPAANYSGGMRRRLDLAMSLVGGPRIIFLDEPTTGLDPRSRQVMWGIVRELVAEGVTVFLTTQYLEEADQLADHVAVLDGGRLVAQGTVSELKKLVPTGHVLLQFNDPATFDAAIEVLGDVSRDYGELTLQVPSDGSIESVRELVNRLAERSVTTGQLSVQVPNLDDVFFALTGSSSPDRIEVGAS